jgi:hypothetical protein
MSIFYAVNNDFYHYLYIYSHHYSNINSSKVYMTVLNAV